VTEKTTAAAKKAPAKKTKMIRQALTIAEKAIDVDDDNDDEHDLTTDKLTQKIVNDGTDSPKKQKQDDEDDDDDEQE
jgi:hypothetical protein